MVLDERHKMKSTQNLQKIIKHMREQEKYWYNKCREQERQNTIKVYVEPNLIRLNVAIGVINIACWLLVLMFVL